MNILNKTTLKTLLKNKTRTAVTIIGIVLSSALLCTVTAFVSSYQYSMIQNNIYNYGDWHRSVLGTDYGSFETLLGIKSVDSAVYTQVIGFTDVICDGDITGEYNYVIGTSGNFDEQNMAVHVTKGKYPSSSSEILLPDSYENKYKMGDAIEIELNDRVLGDRVIYSAQKQDSETMRYKETRTYTVSGFYNLCSWTSRIFEYRSFGAAGLVTLADETLTDEHCYNIYFKMKNPGDALGTLSSEFYYVNNADSGSTNYDLLSYYGVTADNTFNFVIWGIAAGVMVIVMLGSVSLIYNAFSISVSERTALFGLLSSVGATRTQIKAMVITEGLILSVVGIPLGIAAGLGVVNVIISFMAPVFAYTGANVPLTLHISPAALIVAAAVGVATVVISAYAPAKKATEITAVEAINRTKEISDRQVKTSPIVQKLFGLSGVLASKYYKRSGKRYRVTVASLSFSIVLFVSIAAIADYSLAAVFYDTRHSSYDMYIALDEDRHEVEPDHNAILTELRNAAGVTSAAHTMVASDNSTRSKLAIQTEIDVGYLTQEAIDNHWAHDIMWTKYGIRDSSSRYVMADVIFVDDGTFLKLLEQYGLDEDTYMNADDPTAVVVDGWPTVDEETGRHITRKILSSDSAEITVFYCDIPEPNDEYFIYASPYFDENGDYYVNVYYQSYSGGGEDKEEDIPGEKHTLKTGKIIYDLPYFVYNWNNPLMLIYPESAVDRVDIPNCRSLCDDTEFYIQCDNATAASNSIASYMSKQDIRYSMDDRAAKQKETRSLITLIQSSAYIFVAIIALISVANVFNVITTNVGLRRREFAMLKSIGMTSGGFNGMMNYECLFYGIRSLVSGLPASLAVVTAVYFIMGRGYELPFMLPWTAIIISIAGVFAAVFITMLYAMHKVKRANPIDELKNENI